MKTHTLAGSNQMRPVTFTAPQLLCMLACHAARYVPAYAPVYADLQARGVCATAKATPSARYVLTQTGYAYLRRAVYTLTGKTPTHAAYRHAERMLASLG